MKESLEMFLEESSNFFIIRTTGMFEVLIENLVL